MDQLEAQMQGLRKGTAQPATAAGEKETAGRYENIAEVRNVAAGFFFSFINLLHR